MKKVLNLFEHVMSVSRKYVQDISDDMFFDMFIRGFYDKSKRIDRILLDVLIIKLTYKDAEVVEPICHNGDMRVFLYRIFHSENYDLSKLLGSDDDEILQNYIDKYGNILDANRLSSLLYKDEILRILELSNELESTVKNRRREVLMADSFTQILKSEFLSGVIELDCEKKEHTLKVPYSYISIILKQKS